MYSFNSAFFTNKSFYIKKMLKSKHKLPNTFMRKLNLNFISHKYFRTQSGQHLIQETFSWDYLSYRGENLTEKGS